MRPGSCLLRPVLTSSQHLFSQSFFLLIHITLSFLEILAEKQSLIFSLFYSFPSELHRNYIALREAAKDSSAVSVIQASHFTHFSASLDVIQERSDDLWHVQVEDRPIYQVKATAGESWCECKEFASLEIFQHWNAWKAPWGRASKLRKPGKELNAYLFCISWIPLQAFTAKLALTGFTMHQTVSSFLPPIFSCTWHRVRQGAPETCRPPAKRTSLLKARLLEIWVQQSTMASKKREKGKCPWPLLQLRAPSTSVMLLLAGILTKIKHKPAKPSLMPHHHSESSSFTPLLHYLILYPITCFMSIRHSSTIRLYLV